MFRLVRVERRADGIRPYSPVGGALVDGLPRQFVGRLKKEGRRPSFAILFVFADNLFLPGFFAAVRATHFSCSAHMGC